MVTVVYVPTGYKVMKILVQFWKAFGDILIPEKDHEIYLV